VSALVLRRSNHDRGHQADQPDTSQNYTPRAVRSSTSNSKTDHCGGGVTAEQMEMQWLKPTLVAQIQFVEWTTEGRLRHAAFLGLRTDKAAKNAQGG
jgi:ATP-dependent DNA ligase